MHPNGSRACKGKRFVIACGGTGGHLFPGISVAQELRRRGHEVLLLVSEKEVDRRALEGHPELPSRQVTMIGMPRPWSPAMAGFIVKFWQACRTCRRLLRAFSADAVLGMGGFTSYPPVLAGRRLGLPTFIHESNAIPGKANRRTAKSCSAVFVGLAACAPHFEGMTCHVVGTPVRDVLRGPVDRTAAYAFFGLEPAKKTLLVTGGSQGARAVNRAVCAILDRIDPEKVQCLHLTGELDFEETRRAYEASGVPHHVAPFCDRMDYALAVADTAITRAGASSLAELATFGVPAVLIPYPYAAEDHQTLNAAPYVEGGAALMVDQANLTPQVLWETLEKTLFDDASRKEMREKMREFSSGDANIKICDIMEAQLA